MRKKLMAPARSSIRHVAQTRSAISRFSALSLAGMLLAGLLVLSPAADAAARPLVAKDSQIEFVVKEMGVPVDGRFSQFEALIDIDPARPELSSASLRIDVGSLTTGNEEADAIATGPDWLDKDHSRYAVFTSMSIRALGGGRYEAKGHLTIRNKTRDIAIQFSGVEQPDGRMVVASEFTIQRSEFGVGGGVWNQGGVVAEAVPVKVHLVLAPAVGRNNP